jgi:hypothetical protein
VCDLERESEWIIFMRRASGQGRVMLTAGKTEKSKRV